MFKSSNRTRGQNAFDDVSLFEARERRKEEESFTTLKECVAQEICCGPAADPGIKQGGEEKSQI